VDLTVRLDRVLKGRTEGPAVATVQVRQYTPAGAFIFAVPGAWSNQDIVPGAAFVTFSIADGGSWPDLLDDSQCRRVFPSELALPDVELASLADSPELPVARLLASTADRKGAYGALFASYLEARLPELFLGTMADFDRVIRELEDPELSSVARRILCEGMYAKMILLDPIPSRFIARLIEGTMRMLALPFTEGLGRNIIGTYLPNLLGIEGGAMPKNADTIFDGKPELRAQAITVFESAGAAEIVRWLRS
jgi:hypothetical protein